MEYLFEILLIDYKNNFYILQIIIAKINSIIYLLDLKLGKKRAPDVEKQLMI